MWFVLVGSKMRQINHSLGKRMFFYLCYHPLLISVQVLVWVFSIRGDKTPSYRAASWEDLLLGASTRRLWVVFGKDLCHFRCLQGAARF